MATGIIPLEERLLSIENINDDSAYIEEFKNIMSSIRSEDKKRLGQKFIIWKLTCLYTILTFSKYRTDILYKVPQIIGKIQELKMELSKNKSEDLLKMLKHSSKRASSEINV